MADQFIGVIEDAVPDSLCDYLIEQFEAQCKFGRTMTRQVENPDTSKQRKDDTVWYSHESPLAALVPGKVYNEFNDCLWAAYREYAEPFSHALSDSSEAHYSFYMKVQKTEVGQGYHVWHYESGNRDVCNRLLAWTAYLNDVEEGGETEFLYQHQRIKAKKGTISFFPAGFTHLHRGNPPISNTKYIATGWIEF